MPADCPGDDSRSSSLMRRASSNITINSTTSQSQIFTDPDVLNVSNDSPKKPPKRPKIFGGSNRGILVTKTQGGSSKSATISSAPVTPTSAANMPIKGATLSTNTNTNAHATDSSSLTNSLESSTNSTTTQLPPPPATTTTNGRKNARFHPDQTLNVNTRTTQLHVKPDRRKDIKLTNCQEKDGIWTATGQFGRESRHSKRADITYDKKKFRFIQKDEQGNKHVFEILASDIDCKVFFEFLSKYFCFSIEFSSSSNSIIFEFIGKWFNGSEICCATVARCYLSKTSLSSSRYNQ